MSPEPNSSVPGLTLKVNMAMTLDGKVMRPDGKWHGLTSAGDRHRMDIYRVECDALIVGRNSVVQDNPVVVPRNVGPGRAIPRPVMICRSELPNPEVRLFQESDPSARPLLLIAARLESEAIAAGLTDLADIRTFPPDQLTPLAALQTLADLGCNRILLEGGPRLNYAFFRDDLVDVLFFTLVPYIIGQSSLPGIVDGPAPFPGFDARAWDLHRAHTIGNEVFFEYRRVRPANPEVGPEDRRVRPANR